MKLTQLSPPAGAKQNRKRAGRGYGSGRGKTCGKGMNGQKVRSGAKVGLGFEGGQTPLHRRLPKRRGVSKGAMNIGLFRQQFTEVNVGQLESLFESGATVTADSLAALKLSARKDAGVRILGDGELTKSLTVVVDHVSATAREKIESAGGTVEVN